MAKLTPLSFAALLMVSSALVSPAAFAQETPVTQNPGGAETPVDETGQEEIEISGPGAGGNSEIVVRGRFIPNPIRATAEVLSVLSEADIARTADGDIAGSLQRVTGLSVVGGASYSCAAWVNAIRWHCSTAPR